MTSALCAALCLTQSCKDAKKVQEKTAVVKIDTVRAYGHAVRLEFPGKVTAARETNLAFQVAGKLRKIHGDAGTFIRKGQVIAELDDRDYKLQLNAAEAEYNSIKQRPRGFSPSTGTAPRQHPTTTRPATAWNRSRPNTRTAGTSWPTRN